LRDGIGLNERAAADGPGIGPLWHVDKGMALFAGPLNRNALHRHSVPVFLAGLYGSFRLRVALGDWRACRTAVIPAGIAYEFDMRGDPLGVFYLEPNVARADALAPLVGNAREADGALTGTAGEVRVMREAYEDAASGGWIAEALADLIAFSEQRAARSIDGRVARAVETLQLRYGDLMPADELARSVGLSASRFQHIFTEEVGVPFRRYRAWHRLRAAIREIVQGSNFARAAHAAGFSDQAHFAREFRRTFGAPASPGLSTLRRA
jgi:AraC-like DNA-binding protein